LLAPDIAQHPEVSEKPSVDELGSAALFDQKGNGKATNK